MIDIVPVRNDKDLDRFIEFPYALYRENRYWVPPLRRDVRHLFDVHAYPFWQHAERELYLVYRGKHLVGRVCAMIDYNFIEFWGEKTGYFGFFECEDDEEAAQALLSAAKDFNREKGMASFIGPMNPSTNDEVGFLLEGYFSPPMVMMPYTFEYYHRLMAACGLAKAKDLYAFYVEASAIPMDRLERVASLVRQRVHDLKVRPIRLSDFRNEVGRIQTVYNDAWSRNWGFVPMTDAEFAHLAKTLKDLVTEDLVVLAEIDGAPVGVSLTIPNYNIIVKQLGGRLGLVGMIKFLRQRHRIKEARLMIMGVRKDFQHLGLEAPMLLETMRAVQRLGITGGEMSWTLEDNDNVNNTITKMGGTIYKKYRIYQGTVS